MITPKLNFWKLGREITNRLYAGNQLIESLLIIALMDAKL